MDKIDKSIFLCSFTPRVADISLKYDIGPEKAMQEQIRFLWFAKSN